MIEMSWFGPPAAGRPGLEPRSVRTRLAWHAACILMLTGCPYIQPVQRPAVNHAPDILRPNEPDKVQSLVLDGRNAFVQVWAEDEDLDDLWIEWDGIPASVEIPQDASLWPEDYNGQEIWVAVYEVPWHPDLDGRRLTATVMDLEPRGTVQIVWSIEVE